MVFTRTNWVFIFAQNRTILLTVELVSRWALVNWSELPDLAAVALLSCAFASVVRRNRTPVSGLWLTGWIMIVLHFAAFMFLTLPGNWGNLAGMAGLIALVWA